MTRTLHDLTAGDLMVQQPYWALATESVRTAADRMLEQGRSLYANLEFYKGVVYRAIGLPPECFTAAFAMARVFGYLAHFMESRADNRLIRPAARYVGPAPS